MFKHCYQFVFWTICLSFIVSLTPAANISQAQEYVPDSAKKLEDKSLPKDLEGIGINPNLGTSISLDTQFMDENGKDVTLAKYFDGKKPVVIVMAYYSCPMLCGVMVDAAREAFEGLDWEIGNQYRVVTISFDAKESWGAAQRKKDSVVKSWNGMKPLTSPEDWVFLTGKEADSRKIADELGFGYKWNEETNQFAHAAGIFILSPQGKLSRVLFGINYQARDLKLALLEASEGKVGNLAEKFLLFCYSYDPKANKYALLATRVMKAGGGLTVLIILLAYASLFIRSRKNGRA